MSNYYKNSVLLNNIINGCTNSNVQNAYKILNSATNTFTSSINETPSNLLYNYQGTDISTYCIATYVESSGTTFTSIPSWCTKIRAILVGGGGSGAKGLSGVNHTAQHTRVNQQHNSRQVSYGYNNYNDQNNTGTNNIANSDNAQDDRNQNGGQHYQNIHNSDVPAYQDSGSGGGGGGGGAFLYLSNTQVQGVSTFQVSTPAIATATTLTIGATTYTANGGKTASGTSAGAFGSASNGTINASGSNGSAASGAAAGSGGAGGLTSTYSSALSLLYGDGGAGSNGVGGDETAGNATSGQTGYYRIYFLTG